MTRFSYRNLFIYFVSIALLALYLVVWISFARSAVAKRTDFIIYYTAGSVPLAKLYNLEAQREFQSRVIGSSFPVTGGVLPFNHTPVFVPLLHLLVNDNYTTSYLRWTTLLWLAALGCALVIFKMTGDPALAIAAASFYPLFTLIQQAHDTIFLLLGVLLCAHFLSQRKDLLAGIALSLAALKPHFAVFLAVPLMARPRAFMGWCAASALLALYGLALVGTRGVSDFLGILKISAAGEGFGIRPLFMLNLLGLLERSGVSASVVRPLVWIVFFLSAIFLLILWKRRPLHPPFALTILLAVFTSPHLYGHDLALLLASFATLSKPNPLFLVAASVILVSLNIIPNNPQLIVVYVLMGALLAMILRDLYLPSDATV